MINSSSPRRRGSNYLQALMFNWIPAFAGMTLVLFGFLFPVTCYLNPIYAHSVGQPPYFKVNGEYVLYYSVPVTSLYDFDLPQDFSPHYYLINQPINFEIDTTQLPVSPELIQKTSFRWELGDGSGGQGLKLTHTYTKPGSYILNILVDDKTTPTPQLLEKTLVNILPNKDYKLPRAIIKVNGQKLDDPNSNSLTLKFNAPLVLDGSESISGSSKIVSYFWDLGDQHSFNGSQTEHEYSNLVSQIFPVLRIKDQNGFIADSFVSIQNADLTNNTPFTPITANQSGAAGPKPKTPSQLKYTLPAIFLIVVLSIIGVKLFKKKKTVIPS